MQHNSEEKLNIIPNLFEVSDCTNVWKSKQIFSNQFINELSEEVKQRSLKHVTPLANLEFEQEWHSIMHFFIYPVLCQIFDGLIESMNDEFHIIKQSVDSNALDFTTSNSHIGHNLNFLLTLSQPEDDFIGGSLNFFG